MLTHECVNKKKKGVKVLYANLKLVNIAVKLSKLLVFPVIVSLYHITS